MHPQTMPHAPASLVRVRRALISVSDKAGIVQLAKDLASRGVEIISTGGTAQTLLDAGVPVHPIETVTGFPEMMDGRVKTLHPNIHGALLARRDNPQHMDALESIAGAPIDLVVVNLYPFEQTIERPDCTDELAIENIDIGGPSMIRSAAKNHASVAVLTDPAQYDTLRHALDEHDGQTSLELRRALAAQAFARTAAYDAEIAAYMHPGIDEFPKSITHGYTRVSELRYGENPHQRAALYARNNAPSGTIIDAKQLHGKELSFNNLNDASAALETVRAMRRADPKRVSACVVKHTNPCGAATAKSAHDAIDAAIAGDPLAAFGGILATTATIDERAAERIADDATFFEVIIAPRYDKDALEILQDRWKNIRLLAVADADPVIERELKWIPGGALVQERDLVVPDPAAWTHAAGPAPTDDTLRAGAILESVCAKLSSNAVLIGGHDNNAVRLFGAGAGQMDRVAACQGAVRKAGQHARNAIAVSDAFFPFPDGPEILIDAGVSTIIHPGGSKRDDETFELCERANVTCLTTGVRHFRH